MLSEGHCKIHYGSMEFTYKGKEKAESVEWTEKNINEELIIYLQRHLTSKSIKSSNVKLVQVVVDGNHGDTALDVLAGVDATNEENKKKLSERKADVLLTQQKQQSNTGRIQAMEYFDNT